MLRLKGVGVRLCLAGMMCIVSFWPLMYVLGTAWGRRQELALHAEMYKSGMPEYLSARVVLMSVPLAVGAVLIVAGLPVIRRPTRQRRT
jgi:hypothetical protein